ncbi:MAG: hypothetical protein QM753_20595 [Thermomicrobiales bacterium]
MRRSLSASLHAMVIITLLLSVLSPVVLAQPAPNPCPAGQVYFPEQNLCVPEGEVPPDDGSGQPTATEEPTVPAGDLASFTLYHLACDDDFDADAVRDAGGSGPANGCVTFGKPPFTYTIAANQVPILTTTLDATARNFARFDVPSPIPAGTLTITVTPVEAYTTEFISCGISVGGGFRDIVEPSIVAGSATLPTMPDQDIECWVYNVKRAPKTTATEATVTVGGGSVSIGIYSVSCLAGTVIDADLDRSCTEGLANVTYKVLSETETLALDVTDGNGVLTFENMRDGRLAIVESLPAGYGKPYVLCTHYSSTSGDRQYAPTIEFGTGFMASVAPGDELGCTWYNFPAAGPDNGPTIMIQTRPCKDYGEGFPAETSLAEADAWCPGFTAFSEFQVSLDGQDVATDESNNVNGQVTFIKLPVSESGGPYGIALLPDPTTQTVAVYCDKDNGDGVYEVVPSPLSAPNRIDQPLAAGETLRCSWFINYDLSLAPSVPATIISDQSAVDPGVILVARLCDPGAERTPAQIDAACTTAGSGITFNVDASGEPYLNTTTDTEGVIDVPLPVGDTTFTITPQVPDGYGLPSYLCTSIWPGGGSGGKVVGLTEDSPFHDLAWVSDSKATCTYYFPVIAEDEGANPPQGIVADDRAAEDEAAPEATDEGSDPSVAAEQETPGPDQTLPEPQVGQSSPVANAGNDVPGSPMSEESGVSVLVRHCPPEAAQPDAALDKICTQPASGLTFEILVDGEAVGTSVTDAKGKLAVPADAGPAMYLFRHQPAADLKEMRTECSSVYANGATAKGQSRATGSQMREVNLSFDGESRVTCTFNLIADSTGDSPGATGGAVKSDGNTTGSHRFTLQFWTCPDGVDPAADKATLAQACSVETGERTLMLTIDGHTTGETISSATTWEFHDSTVYADIGVQRPVRFQLGWSGYERGRGTGYGRAGGWHAHGDRHPSRDHRLLHLVPLP